MLAGDKMRRDKERDDVDVVNGIIVGSGGETTESCLQNDANVVGQFLNGYGTRGVPLKESLNSPKC